MPSYFEEYIKSNLYLHSLLKTLDSIGKVNSSLIASVFTTLAAIFVFIFIGILRSLNMLTDELLSSLMGFASGALLGDVVMHLLPSTDLTQKAQLLILSGMLGFYILDRLMGHDHDEKEHGKDHGKKHNSILLLLADILHNTTDGMAIGASFSISTILGVTTTFAIFFHEIAHEVGDFIAFLNSGYSLKKSLFFNLLTGIGSLAGSYIASNYGNLEAMEQIVLPLVVGNFLYIGLASMLGSLKDQHNKSNLIWEVIFFCIGVGLMICMEALE
mmetsp:Transcript_963/g.955  ORF Transcript_963/g.955 Transcript_963/m.955 type:complete len:272 (+) Transcript_963:211-1026(+)